MTGIFNTAFRNIRALMLVTVTMAFLAGGQAYSKTVEMNVFDAFRYAMASNPDASAPRFMARGALSKWSAIMTPYFGGNTRQLNHFFAFSMILPRKNSTGFHVVYFNPWVDGVLLTQWGKTDQGWKMQNFHLSSGERVRGEAPTRSGISKNSAIPVWMRKKGPVMENIFSYHKNMRELLVGKTAADYNLWLSLDNTAIGIDLLLVKLRTKARVDLALKYIADDKMGKVFARNFADLKKQISTKNAVKLASYGPHAKLLLELPATVVNTLSDNWLIKGKSAYGAFLSSPVTPRWFVYMSMGTTGKITGVLFGDLETMAELMSTGTPSVQQIKKFKTPKGEVVEIVIEKKGGSEFMITRINGKVIERLPL